jgi:hypothetical protein
MKGRMLFLVCLLIFLPSAVAISNVLPITDGQFTLYTAVQRGFTQEYLTLPRAPSIFNILAFLSMPIDMLGRWLLAFGAAFGAAGFSVLVARAPFGGQRHIIVIVVGGGYLLGAMLLLSLPFIWALAFAWSGLLFALNKKPLLAIVLWAVAISVDVNGLGPVLLSAGVVGVVLGWPVMGRMLFPALALSVALFITAAPIGEGVPKRVVYLPPWDVRYDSAPADAIKALTSRINAEYPMATVLTDQGPAVAYFASEAQVIDVRGQMLNQIDRLFLLPRYAPDVLLISPDLLDEASLANRYTLLEERPGVRLFARVVEWAGFVDHGVDVNYTASTGRQDLRLYNVAIADRIVPGQVVRIRLDWEVRFSPQFEEPIELKMNLLDANFAGISSDAIDKIPGHLWPVGKFSTYHTLTTRVDGAEGLYGLWLNVQIRGAIVSTLKVADVEVKR